MEYKITITKTELNPDYEEKRPQQDYHFNQCETEPYQEKYIEKFKTTATLTEEQWKKVQKAIIEVME